MANNRMDCGFTQPPARYMDLDHEEKEAASSAMFDTLMAGDTFHGSTFQTAEEIQYCIEEVFGNSDVEFYHETLKMLMLADTPEKLVAARNNMLVITATECDEFCNSIVFDR